jgi:hypothetical protein
MDKPTEIKRQYLLGIMEEIISSHVKLIYVRRGINKHIHKVENYWNLHIIIDEKTTINDLRSAWKEIARSRVYLIENQGQDPTLFPNLLLQYIYDSKSFYSYLDISTQMNFFSLVYIIWAKNDIRWNVKNPCGKKYFFDLLRIFQFNEQDIQKWEEIGNEAIRDNKLPWGLKDGPISNRRVIDTIRQYQKKLQNHTITLSPFLKSESFHFTFATAIIEHYCEDVEILLKKSAPEEFEVFQFNLHTFYHDCIIYAKDADSGDVAQ